MEDKFVVMGVRSLLRGAETWDDRYFMREAFMDLTDQLHIDFTDSMAEIVGLDGDDWGLEFDQYPPAVALGVFELAACRWVGRRGPMWHHHNNPF